ncbi:MAG TPA: alpha/beta hydrolase family protein [Ramlibacter sp.]|nr:alpha/beta hydrolase family protein [Ramlibacter sp.]
MAMTRRDFCERLALGGGLVTSGAMRADATAPLPQAAGAAPASHIGNLYPFVQQQADRSPLELSFLRPEFKNLQEWQPTARRRIFDHLFYSPPAAAPQAQLIRRTDKGRYIEEYLTFQTTPDLRVPAYVLIPANAKLPAPGIVVLHSHDGVYLWGKEKVVAADNEHPYITAFKGRSYGGRSIASELAAQGYVVVAIDAFYWGERRMVLDDDPQAYRDRPLSMTDKEIQAFNARASQNEALVARSLFTAGITWPGVLLWDDIRTLDYLASRPEVDASRLGCVGLSVGGYRSFFLATLDERIKAAVDVGWMTSFAAQIKGHVINTVGLSFHINGLYRYLDLPDMSALIAPRALLAINGSRDRLFALQGVKSAFDKIAKCYAKAGASERQRCTLYDAPHEFNLEMQAEAWEWLRRWV